MNIYVHWLLNGDDSSMLSQEESKNRERTIPCKNVNLS